MEDFDLSMLGKNYVTYRNWLFNVIFLFVIVFITVIFVANKEIIEILFLLFDTFLSIVIFLLPVAIILSVIKRTKKIGGALLYFVAALYLTYVWLYGLELLNYSGGTIWAIVGVGIGLFTNGYGLFTVVIVNSILNGSWSNALMYLGIPIICRLILNLGEWLMEITLAQVKEKIVSFELEQNEKIKETEEKIAQLEKEREGQAMQIMELNDELEGLEIDYNDEEEFDGYESETEFESDELEDDIEIKKLKIAMLKAEVEMIELQKKFAEAKKEVEKTSQEKESSVEEGGELIANIIDRNDYTDREILRLIIRSSNRLKQGSIDWLFNEANLALLDANVSFALKLFDTIIEQDPNQYLHYYNRARANASIGNLREFVIDYEKAIELCADEEILFREVYDLIKQMPTEIIDRASEKLKQRPLRKISFENKDQETRVNDIRFIMDQMPKNMEQIKTQLNDLEVETYSLDWYVREGLNYWREGDRETALEHLNIAIDLEPDDEYTLLNRGNLQIELGHFEEGFQDLETAQSLNPEVPAMLLFLKNLSPEIREEVRQNIVRKQQK